MVGRKRMHKTIGIVLVLFALVNLIFFSNQSEQVEAQIECFPVNGGWGDWSSCRSFQLFSVVKSCQYSIFPPKLL